VPLPRTDLDRCHSSPLACSLGESNLRGRGIASDISPGWFPGRVQRFWDGRMRRCRVDTRRIAGHHLRNFCNQIDRGEANLIWMCAGLALLLVKFFFI